MATFSPSDAAFEGFRLTREKPKALLIWAVASFVSSLLTVPVMIATGYGEAMALAEQGGSDPNATLDVLAKAGPIALVIFVAALVVQSMFYAAVYRAVLRPQDNAFGYLRLGMDEVRQMVLFLVLILILMVAVFVIVLLGSILAVVASGLISAAGGQALAGLVGLCIGLWVFGLVVYVAVRLSLSLPMTFAERRLRIVSAWKLTKGHFWRLLGAYGLAVVLMIVVSLLAMIIFYAVAAIIGAAQGLDLADTMAQYEANLTSLKAYFTLPTLMGAAFGAVLAAIYYAVVVAPSAAIYKALSAAADNPTAGAEANMI